MFEKEAEEYANEYGQDAFTQFNIPHMIEPVRIERKLGFQKGAEFGYNKANEWHYVKNGDLPKYDVLADDISITVLNQNGNKVFYNFLEKVWKLEVNNKISKVIAWKEIVLPELKESE